MMRLVATLTDKESRFIMTMCEEYVENLGHGITMRGNIRIYPSELLKLDNKVRELREATK